MRETMGDDDDGGGGRDKPYMVSISGKTLADNLIMLRRISDAVISSANDGSRRRIAAVELNLACPNIVGKPTIGYDYDQMEEVLREVSSLPCFADDGGAGGGGDGGGIRPSPSSGSSCPPTSTGPTSPRPRPSSTGTSASSGTWRRLTPSGTPCRSITRPR